MPSIGLVRITPHACDRTGEVLHIGAMPDPTLRPGCGSGMHVWQQPYPSVCPNMYVVLHTARRGSARERRGSLQVCVAPCAAQQAALPTDRVEPRPRKTVIMKEDA